MLQRRSVLGSLALSALPRRGNAELLSVLAPPVGDVVLAVKGRIAVTNGDGTARFDRDQLQALGTTELRTGTPWIEGVGTFAGVSGKRFLDALGATGSMLRATALNDYKVEIPVSDLTDYPVLLAMSLDGVPLSVRERGPIWVIYPWTDFPMLDDRVHRQRAIWQLSEIVVE